MMLRDIREPASGPDAYAAELRRRWGGLWSYRYIGRSEAAMDWGATDATVTLCLPRDKKAAPGVGEEVLVALQAPAALADQQLVHLGGIGGPHNVGGLVGG
jgi:hypothetical protein